LTKWLSLSVILLYCIVGLYAPFLASSKPIAVHFDGHWYFPLFRYLFFPGFYTKSIDLFFNALMFAFPLLLLGFWRRPFIFLGVALQVGLFSWAMLSPPSDPAFVPPGHPLTSYARLDRALDALSQREQHNRLEPYLLGEVKTLWDRSQRSPTDEKLITFRLMPLLRPHHWQDDIGGGYQFNQRVPWWERSRSNGKDLAAALLFGVRVSLVVGISAVVLSLAIGLPLGAIAGFYGGRLDLILSRLIEIWEAMPTFFMLLTVVAIVQTKSIFLVVLVLGIFGWTGFSRYLRGEVLKHRNRAYVEGLRAVGFSNRRILFSDILPNAIPPLLTLLPFAVMAAITSEAGLSFLGLGEEGSTSWGVLMDEGRAAFPAESYLLWPPAIVLTILLVAIALAGDALRDALDPKLKT
jgi:peptide/nickel transport system permease protein